jgi:hypothetical protein
MQLAGENVHLLVPDPTKAHAPCEEPGSSEPIDGQFEWTVDLGAFHTEAPGAGPRRHLGWGEIELAQVGQGSTWEPFQPGIRWLGYKGANRNLDVLKFQVLECELP